MAEFRDPAAPYIKEFFDDISSSSASSNSSFTSTSSGSLDSVDAEPEEIEQRYRESMGRLHRWKDEHSQAILNWSYMSELYQFFNLPYQKTETLDLELLAQVIKGGSLLMFNRLNQIYGVTREDILQVNGVELAIRDNQVFMIRAFCQEYGITAEDLRRVRGLELAIESGNFDLLELLNDHCGIRAENIREAIHQTNALNLVIEQNETQLLKDFYYGYGIRAENIQRDVGYDQAGSKASFEILEILHGIYGIPMDQLMGARRVRQEELKRTISQRL